MTKIELLRQYIGDLKMHVTESQGRNNRIAVLEEELEHEQLQNTSSNSDYAKLKEALESIADCGGCLTGEDAQEMKQMAIEALQ